jgi:hypothetical protein
VSRECNLADGWVFDWFDWSLSIVPVMRGAPMVDQGRRSGSGGYEASSRAGSPVSCGTAALTSLSLGGRPGLVADGRLSQVHDTADLKQ